MIDRLKSIVRRMAEVKDMYKLVRYVNTDTYDSSHGTGARTEKQAITTLQNLYIQSGWRGKIKKRSRVVVLGTMADAISHGYIALMNSKDFGMAFDTTTKGRKFVAKKWHTVPVGLLEESSKAYPELRGIILSAFGLIFTIIGAVVGAIVSAIVTYRLSK